MQRSTTQTVYDDSRKIGVQTHMIRTTENQPLTPSEKIMVFLSYFLLIITFPISILICLKVAYEYERIVAFRLGRLRNGNPKGPGIIFILPCIDECYRIDMRTSSFRVPPQEILTKDSVTIQVDAVVYYKLIDPLRVIIQVENAFASTQLLGQTTLRNVAGTKMLIDLLTSKDKLSQEISDILEKATDSWGVMVERVEIKDIVLPVALQRSMAAEQEAVREAKAKIAAAEGELKASQALKEASDIMAQNPTTIQLRYLQTMNTVASNHNHTIIVPFPTGMVRNFLAALSSGSGSSSAPPSTSPSPASCGPTAPTPTSCECNQKEMKNNIKNELKSEMDDSKFIVRPKEQNYSKFKRDSSVQADLSTEDLQFFPCCSRETKE